MARSTKPTADPTRRAAFASGLFYLITFAASIPAALLLAPVLTDPHYIVGAGQDTQIALACVLDFVNAITAVGSAVAVFSVLRRHHESLALGFVATRLLEAAIIVPGICAMLAVVSIRQAGPAAGADDGTLIAVGQGLVHFRNWTFILGPSLIPGFNALMFATLLYRTRLVPRWIPALGLIGGPLLISSVAGVVLGLHQLGSLYSGIATAPIFVWELAVGLWMTFKGFNRNAPKLTSGSPDDDRQSETRKPVTSIAAPVAMASAPISAPASAATSAPVSAPAQASAPASASATASNRVSAASSASATRFARFRFQPKRRHVLVVAGLWLAIVGNAAAKDHGIGIPTLIAFSLIPSLPLLLGIGQPKRAGRIATRVVLPFNLSHEPLVPTAVFALGVAGLLPMVATVGAMVWLGSIVVAWGLGDGLRDTDGSVRNGLRRMTSWPGLSTATPIAA